MTLKLLKKKKEEKIRNIGIVAHVDAGKTTTSEMILFYTGKIRKTGKVHEGNTEMDWLEEEKKRKITIVAANTTCYWKNYTFNLIDTPGHLDFTAEVERSMKVLDSVIIVVCASSLVQPQTEKVWMQAKKYSIPKLVFINKMDRLGADWNRCLESLYAKFNCRSLPLFIPLGVEENFIGVLDVLKEKRVLFIKNDDELEYQEITNSKEKELCSFYRELVIETLKEFQPELNLFSSLVLLKSLIRELTLSEKIVPIFVGSAMKKKGIKLLLDGVIDYLASPLEMLKSVKIEKIVLKPFSVIEKVVLKDVTSAVLGFVFKVIFDSFLGFISFMRVYKGVFKKGSYFLNVNKNKREKISNIFLFHANKRTLLEEATAGMIVGISGFKFTSTSDTLLSYDKQKEYFRIEKIQFPKAVVKLSILPVTKKDEDKLPGVLAKVLLLDPTFHYSIDHDTREIIIEGMGKLHLEIWVSRIKNEFDINLTTSIPSVSYRETIESSVDFAEGKYIMQHGGHGQYGHVILGLSPTNTEEEFVFVNKIVGGLLKLEHIRAVKNGIESLLRTGILTGSKIINIKVTLYGGSFHEVDSSDKAFEIAAKIAFKDAFLRSSPILKEPIMRVYLSIPLINLGSIMALLVSKRGKILGLKENLNYKEVEALVPLSKLFNLSGEVLSLTKGSGFFSLLHEGYKKIPEKISEKIIEQYFNNRLIKKKK